MTDLHPPIDPWLGPLPRALLAGGARDLLSPLRLQDGARGVPARPPQREREQLASSLAAFNAAVDHPRATELARELADPGVEVVVTGQQAGLFGGPVYALDKALAATLWARRLADAGRRSVAVFWIASEDHDFDEVCSACLGPVSVRVEDDDPRRPTLPVAERVVGPDLHRRIEEAAAEAADDAEAPPFLRQALETAAECYREGEPWHHGFARLMVELLGDDCPLLLDSRDPVLKSGQLAVVERMLRRLPATVAALEGREADIGGAGFELQIPSFQAADGVVALPLFAHREGCRYRVLWDARRPDDYALRGHDDRGTLEELLTAARDRPGTVSPTALLRPVLQDAALGTTLQLLGPGELAYVPQAAPLYDVLEVEAPAVALRPQALYLPARHGEHYAALVQEGLDAATLLGPWEDLERCLAARGDNGTLAALEALRRRFLEDLEGVGRLAEELDPNLASPVDRTRQHVERGLDNFRGRVEKAGAQRAGVVRGRVDRLREMLVPGGRLQERAFCSLWVRAQFGSGFLPAAREALSLDPSRLQVLTVDPRP